MFVFNDFILNGEGHGSVGEVMQGCHYDAGYQRPFFDSRGRRCVTINTGRTTLDKKTGLYVPIRENVLIADLIANGQSTPVFNATSLRKQEWIQLDTVVLKAARARLRAWSDLAAASSYGGFDGMAKSILEHETMDDPGEAVVDMDGLTEGRSDSPKYQLEGLPLPITHSDFWFGKRKLAESRNTGMPLNVTMGEVAGRRVAEMVEKTLIGMETGIQFGVAASYSHDPKVYGYTNYPDRIIKNDLTTPTRSNASTTLAEVLEMRDLLYDDHFFGPFMLYHSKDWDQYLDNDYILTGGNVATQTLRQRLKSIEGIQDVRRLDFFTSTFSLLMVQMTSEVAQAVNGMDITTIQWESQGGMRLNFKVMCIQVPRLRSDINGNCGICHGSTA